jgi:argininosuccinate lyase
MSKMWSGRFSEAGSDLLDEFNASIMFDRNLYAQDIRGSIAHSKMLAKVGILTHEEQKKVEMGLLKVQNEIENDEFDFVLGDEDIHMAVEKRLTELVGDVGKKVHTGRSRNDQVAVDFRMYVQEKSALLKNYVLTLIETLTNLAKDHTETMIPGMTHLQHAQPTSFGFHMLAYASMFTRDVSRIEDAIKRNNFSPLGCAALAGTPHPVDRKMTAEALGFDRPSINCLDTVSDRDFALDMLYNISTIFMHISRLSEELIIWSSSEFGFVTISDQYSTGSSIMPQKKNPDVAELLRGKTGRVYGNMLSLLTVMKGLPLAYNKDTQEDKEGVFDSVATAEISLKILSEMLKTMTVNVENMESACKVGHLSATDLADYLVNQGVPFREAHFITGRAVAKSEELGVDLSELPVDELMALDSHIKNDVTPFLNLRNSMNSRKSEGGTAKERVLEQITYFEEFVKSKKEA